MAVYSVQCKRCKTGYNECAAIKPCIICPDRNTPKCPNCGHDEVLILKKLTGQNNP